ncbi:MAG: alpha/beta hydrolase [Flavobacteriaceae bacterium]|nr:alpha/beta hydrolase [Flavobacteriaceae bacterium]
MTFFKKFLKIALLSFVLIVIIISVLFGHRDISLDKLKAKYAPSPSEFIQVDGMNVHFRDEGNSTDSLPIVLIHGTSSSLHTFEGWAINLKKNHRVVRMDIPGFGLTGPFPRRNYAIENYVEFIKHFLDARGIKQCVLAGNSLGGNIAWRFAVKYPKMVNKLVLIDASGYSLESKDVPIAFKIAKMPILNKILTFITPRFMVKASIENVYVDKSKITDALIDRYFELTLRKGNRQALVDRMKVKINSDVISEIKNIKHPTLVLWGAQDYLIPTKSAYRFHKNLPNDTLVILKDVGHVPMEEKPQESLAAFMDFLSKE